tara:strand:+ start:10164 stop:10556 length:393 start_codon:yes stop_codon:yes gene_type:complete
MSRPYIGGSNAAVETITASKTLTSADHGKTFLVGTDALVITLPATMKGISYTFINSGADGGNIITISPAAADKIIGSIANAAADSVCSASDDGDLVNTKATANKGDRVTLIADGADGWYITEGVGIWAGA